jgi:hypothetical protein
MDTRRPRCPKPLFVGAKTFMKVVKKANAFLIYVLPSLDVEPHPHEFFFPIPRIQGCQYEKKNCN